MWESCRVFLEPFSSDKLTIMDYRPGSMSPWGSDVPHGPRMHVDLCLAWECDRVIREGLGAGKQGYVHYGRF